MRLKTDFFPLKNHQHTKIWFFTAQEIAIGKKIWYHMK